jgi:hypothetical protein
MKLTLSIPRTRPEHLASIPAPEGCESAALLLTNPAGVQYIAERDPSTPVYHVHLPALAAGQEMTCDVSPLEQPKAASGIRYTQSHEKVDVTMADAPFMTFHHSSAYPKPVINPILTPGGANMLRAPMATYGGGEHPWQRGLTLMQGAINGVDCWNEQDQPGFGHTVQDTIKIGHGPLSMVTATTNTWYEQEKPLMTDRRCYRLFDSSREAVVLDVTLMLEASQGPVTIGATKEGGFLCIRVNPTMNAADGGTMGNAYGATDETGCWSKPAHWMDYYGPVEDEVAGFAVFDHPDNFRYPTTWHVRGYGLFAPNCWMFKDDHHLSAGETMTFRWRVVIHTGDTQQADIANRFLDYVDGPRVEWA